MEDLKKIAAPEVALHSSKKDCWLVIDGKVYDVTQFLEDHPGGEEVLLHASDKSYGERLSKYRDLLLAVRKPTHSGFIAPGLELPSSPSGMRLATERSSIKTIVAETKRASTLKKRKSAAEPEASPQGPAIPSFEDFASQRVEPSSPDATLPSWGNIEPESALSTLPSTLSLEGSGAAGSRSAEAISIADAILMEVVSASAVTLAPPYASDVPVKCGSLVSSTALPSPVLSQNSSEVGDVSAEDSSDTDSRQMEGHSVEGLIGPSAPEASAKGCMLIDTTSAITLDPCLSRVVCSGYVDSLVAPQLLLAKVPESMPSSGLQHMLPQSSGAATSQELDDALASESLQPLPQLTCPATYIVDTAPTKTTPASTSTSAASLMAAPATSYVDSILTTTDAPSAHEAMAIDLWSEVDSQVSFPVPTATSLAGTFPSEVPVKQMLTTLQSMIAHDPRLTTSVLKATAEKMTEVLIFMGCPLADWSERVTFLLKLVRRREFLDGELPDRLATLETRQSERKLLLQLLQERIALLRTALSNSDAKVAAAEDKVAQLKLELALAEVELQDLVKSRVQQVEAISAVEGEASSVAKELKELQVQTDSLKAMSAFLFVGLLASRRGP